jgi:hypothetical protein
MKAVLRSCERSPFLLDTAHRSGRVGHGSASFVGTVSPRAAALRAGAPGMARTRQGQGTWQDTSAPRNTEGKEA